MPWLPLACVFAGRALAELWAARRTWACAIAFAAVGWAAFDSVGIAIDRTRPDTREIAKSWVETHIPAGSWIVVDALHHRNTFTAPLDLGPATVREKLRRLSTEPSPYGSNEAYRLYYEFLLAHPGPRPYEQEWTEAGSRVLPVEEYRRLGYRYAMVSSEVFEAFRRGGGWSPGPAGSFYGTLEREAPLLAEFRGGRFLHPGPTIRVYALPGRNVTSSNRGGVATDSSSHR